MKLVLEILSDFVILIVGLLSRVLLFAVAKGRMSVMVNRPSTDKLDLTQPGYFKEEEEEEEPKTLGPLAVPGMVPHRDDGRAGGIFKSYDVIKVNDSVMES